jgi:hypothetical protein
LNVVVFSAHDGAAAVLQAQVVEKYVQVFLHCDAGFLYFEKL